MNTLTNAQIAVINSPLAMKIITNEAKAVIASKNKTTVAMVEVALNAGTEKVIAMYAKLLSEGINAAAILV